MAKIKQDGCWFLRLNAARCYGFACVLAAMVPAQTQTATEPALHSFAGPPKGAHPYASLIRDSAGNIYGTSIVGGTADAFAARRTRALGICWIRPGQETILHTLTGGADRAWPAADVIRDSAGNIYGTTPYGGRVQVGCGRPGKGV